MSLPAHPQPDIALIQNFLDGYRAVRGTAVMMGRSTGDFVIEFERIKVQYWETKALSDERQLREAPEYNIFSVLRAERDEVRTHSAFLCHLLSPHASHGQGTLFLESFLQYCASRYSTFPPLPDFSEPKDWLVSSEEHTNYGRMDIVIQNPMGHFLCVIENKIDAPEGGEQLIRYGKWMKEYEREYPSQALCFLTIKGGMSVTAGTLDYFRLSYHKDIAIWIENVLDKIKAPGVQAVVHQYQALVASL